MSDKWETAKNMRLYGDSDGDKCHITVEQLYTVIKERLEAERLAPAQEILRQMFKPTNEEGGNG
jgi:hypothetical protein